ncbi:MAG: hypothetical protein HPY45_12105 [Anaerolineae bacterium]|nr:hypothetical protein [Anaerolineae bacterium]
MGNPIELACLSCRTKLLVENERLIVCHHCKTVFVVKRGIGVVSLIPFRLDERETEKRDYTRIAADKAIKRLSAEIEQLEEKLKVQREWVRNRKKTERQWLYGYFAARRVSLGEVVAGDADEDTLPELDKLTSDQAKELVAHFRRLSLNYPNDRRIAGLVAAFGNIELLLSTLEAKRKELEDEKRLID